MPDQVTVLELATNLPCRGNLKYVNWRSTQHGERLKLVVDVAPGQEQYPAGRCEAWASIDFEAPMIKWGLIQRSGTNNKGQPDFKVLNSPVVILHMREKKGENGKTVKHLTLGVERNGQVQYFDPSATVAETPAPAPAAPAPKASPNGNGGSQVAEPVDAAKGKARELIMAIADLHFACELLVRERRATVDDQGHRQELSLELPLEQSDAAMVNSLFIELNRSHVQAWPGIHRDIRVILQRRREGKPAAAPPPPPPPAPKPAPKPAPVAAGPGRESFADFPSALEGNEDDDLPF